VIFEAGGGGYGGYGWRVAQSGVAKFTRACWYDRAGEGWSDRPISVRNSSLIANDLHMVLQQIKVNEPVVLLGHSIGGEYIRIYTATFPSDVAGLVLADSTHPDQREPAIMLSPVTRMPNSARQTLCGLLPVASRFGVIRFMLRNTRVNVPPELASHSRDGNARLTRSACKGIRNRVTSGLRSNARRCHSAFERKRQCRGRRGSGSSWEYGQPSAHCPGSGSVLEACRCPNLRRSNQGFP